MPFEQTITVINNSGKIVSTGKHLIGIFKEARSAYKEKKEALRYERAGDEAFRRARTFSGPTVEEADADDGIYHNHHHGLSYSIPPLLLEDHRNRRPRARPSRSRSIDDIDRPANSSLNPESPPICPRRRPTVVSPLTARNLRTHSEISATCPSSVPLSYRNYGDNPCSQEPRYDGTAIAALTVGPNTASFQTAPQRASVLVRRPRSDLAYGSHCNTRRDTLASAAGPFDMNLAYGTIPPDLASRCDLDACAVDDAALRGESDHLKQEHAQSLVGRIESLLDEVQCIHHSAASIIAHLQSNPEAAAAVALTLAELSTLLTKMSPDFLGIVKCGSPAVFALLASPQFLIGTGIAVGVTIVLFGGWKIIKRIQATQQSPGDGRQAQVFETTGPSPAPVLPCQPCQPLGSPLPSDDREPSLMPAGNYEEALVLEQELSTIDTWRRGILPLFDSCDDNVDGWFRMENPWGAADADVELISPEAMRSRIGFGAADDHSLRSVRTRPSGKLGGSAGAGAGTAKPPRHRRQRHRRRAENHQSGSSISDARSKISPGCRDVSDQKNRHTHTVVGRLGKDRIRDNCGDGQEDKPGGRSHSYSDRHRDYTTNTSVSSSHSYHDTHQGRNSHRSGGERKVGSRASESKTPTFLSSSNLPPDGDRALRIKDTKSPAVSGNTLKQLFKRKRNKKVTNNEAMPTAAF